MALLGIYVGVIPVALGMLWLPFVRRVDATWIRVLLAATVGLLGFLAVDATLEALEIAGQGPQALGGAGLVALGAGLAYLALAAVSARVSARASDAGAAGASPQRLAGLVALGIGLHNLGEGLAIGSAYATGALALGAFLVVGFAIHNTTEGLAIVAPLGRSRRPRLGRPPGGARAARRWPRRDRRVDRRRCLHAVARRLPARRRRRRHRPGDRPDRTWAARRGGPHPRSRRRGRHRRRMLVMYATGLLVSA